MRMGRRGLSWEWGSPICRSGPWIELEEMIALCVHSTQEQRVNHGGNAAARTLLPPDVSI